MRFPRKRIETTKQITSIRLTFTHRLVHRNRDRRRRLRALRSPRRPCLESAQLSVFLREERK